MNKKIGISFLLIIFFIPSLSYGEVPESLPPRIMHEGINDCEVHSVNDGLEEGEKVVMCSDSMRYIHRRYSFALVFPRYWDQVHINERKPEELGKITSIAFSPTEERLIMVRL